MRYKPPKVGYRWRLTMSVVDQDGGWEQVYDSEMDGVHNPDYACGFALGWAAALGIEPELITCHLEEFAGD